MKLHYNSPFILTFTFLCIILYFLLKGTGLDQTDFFVLRGSFSFTALASYVSVFTYVLNHADVEHLFGNLSFILLLGPILEERYGSKRLFYMTLTTTLATAILNIIFFSTGIRGASGIVFMLIILISFTNMKNGKIPLTFILVFLLYVGKEVVNSFEEDNISQFAHILGGICGAFFGFQSNRNTQPTE